MSFFLTDFFKNIWERISRMWKHLNSDIKHLAPIVIAVVEKIKMIVESPVADVLTEVIPGDTDEAIKIKLREWLPKILIGLNMVESINDLPDDNAKLQAILALFNNVDPDLRKAHWHGLAALILEKLADGNLSWSDALAIAEYVKKFEKPE